MSARPTRPSRGGTAGGVGGRRPRLIVTDLDGTFLSPDGTVSELNAGAVDRAEAAGIPVVFATGRPIRWLTALQGLRGGAVVIASNGALVYDRSSDRALHVRAIPADVASVVVAEVRAAVPHVSFAVERGRTFSHEPAYQTWEDATVDPAVACEPLDRLLAGGPIVKLLMRSETEDSDTLAETVARIVGTRLTITHSTPGPVGLLELSAAGVTKAAALERLCTERGIEAAEVAGFGDMPNDLDLLTWVGRPYVMAEAHTALDCLDAPVAGSNADSGVGRTILAWLADNPRS